MDDVNNSEQTTQIGLHAVRNLLGSEQQLSLFSENKLKEFAETYGVELGKGISRFGIDLSDTQQRMMEAILNGFSRTRYKGNLDPIDKPSHAKEKYPSGNLPSSYKYFSQVPKLKISQGELLSLAGIKKKSAGDVQGALKALKELGTTQYCFYYTRLALDEEKKPRKERDGDWQKEEVVAVDTLFTIKEIRSKKTGNLEYYEILPSSIFLDQRESYFMLIPFNWREEVYRLIGQKKASSYTFRFILFLRYRFELERRSKRKGSFVLKYTTEEMAINLKMPESVYKRKKDRANKILDEVYSVAKKLGYLKNYERGDVFDLLYLSEEKYQLPRHEEKLLPIAKDAEDTSPEMKQAKELLDLILSERRKIDLRYNPISGGHVREQSLKHLVELIKIRPFEEIKSVICWGVSKKYWCNRIGTASKLRQNFEEAVSEMHASSKEGPANREQENKEFALKIAQKFNGHIGSLGKPIRVEILNQTVEIGAAGEAYPISIKYTENGFETQIENALRKRGISIK